MNHQKQKISYLACPYTHPDEKIKKMRHLLVNRIALECHKRGKLVYSPLTHNLPLIQLSRKENSWDDWGLFDKSMLERCDELLVIQAPGWEQSKGVAAEIAHAKEFNIPIEMINPKEYFGLSLVYSE